MARLSIILFIIVYTYLMALVVLHVVRKARRDKSLHSLSHKELLLYLSQREHECELLPHNDPNIVAVCEHHDCRIARLPQPPAGSGGGSPARSRNVIEQVEEDHRKYLSVPSAIVKPQETVTFDRAMKAMQSYGISVKEIERNLAAASRKRKS